jgi:hypothetical protein
MTDDLTTRAIIERDIAETITKLKLPHRTARSEANSRRLAIRLQYNATATVIADSVLDGETPWHETVARYRILRGWIED